MDYSSPSPVGEGGLPLCGKTGEVVCAAQYRFRKPCGYTPSLLQKVLGGGVGEGFPKSPPPLHHRKHRNTKQNAVEAEAEKAVALHKVEQKADGHKRNKERGKRAR